MITTYASHAILNFILGRTAVTIPSNYKVDLSTSPLGADGIGLVKPVDPAYATLNIPNNKASFSQASDKKVKFINQFTWNESTTDWLPVVSYVMADDSGQNWFYGELVNNPVDVQVETSITLDANTNSFKMDVCGGSSSDMAMITSKANAVLDHFLGRSPSLTPPSTYYLGISSTPLSADGAGMTEPTASEYQRLAIPNDKNSFTVAANNTVTLAKTFMFPTANVAWGKYTHYFISDSATGENVWWTGKLVHNRNVQINTTLVINPNGFNWVLGNCQ